MNEAIKEEFTNAFTRNVVNLENLYIVIFYFVCVDVHYVEWFTWM